jgi:UDP-N-acetylglucosamine 1-carboxyvinyltransferase
LGADLRLEHGYVVATANRLQGADIELSGPSGPTVTGTANVLSAAVLARGVTWIRGAAVEPEIVDLGHFLIALGAKIEGLGTPTLRIQGVDQLGGATHRLIPDRIEAATLLLAVAITGGKATVVGVVPEHLARVLGKLQDAGMNIDVGADRIILCACQAKSVPLLCKSSAESAPLSNTACKQAVAHHREHCGASIAPHCIDIMAEPYPGIPTDLQAQWTALMSVADGTSRVEDRVFPGRFLHVAELNRLGANISCGNRLATITGVKRLSGATVTACDLRASAALVLAGLAAEGRTIVEHIHHLDRGYERLDDKLRQLGAQITRVS